MIEFGTVHSSIIVLNDEDAFRFCAFPFAHDFSEFSNRRRRISLLFVLAT